MYVASMSAARHMLALLKSRVAGDDKQFFAVAMQLAAHEARLGHIKVAQQMRDLIDEAKKRASSVQNQVGLFVVPQARPDLAGLVSVSCPDVRLSSMVLPKALEGRLGRILTEMRQQERLRNHGLSARRKILLIGPPGSGKTLTAAALAGELHLPLFSILLEGVITKFMGETASKLRLIFEAMAQTPGVYLFDEFDAFGARRTEMNDVGEIRRVLNSFLQLLEQDASSGLIVAATNHPDLLDRALFRRFDDVVRYDLPDEQTVKLILACRLALFHTEGVEWDRVVHDAKGLSQAELARAADEAAKQAVLKESCEITTAGLASAVEERKLASR